MLAKVNGLFRLTRDAELIYGNSGTAILKLGLACSEKFKDKETQLFLDAVAFGKAAEILNQHAGSKGTQLFLSGKLETQSWQDQQGQKKSKVSMTIESFEFVGGKNQNQQPTAQPQQNYQELSQPTPTEQGQGQQGLPPMYDAEMENIPF